MWSLFSIPELFSKILINSAILAFVSYEMSVKSSVKTYKSGVVAFSETVRNPREQNFAV